MLSCSKNVHISPVIATSFFSGLASHVAVAGHSLFVGRARGCETPCATPGVWTRDESGAMKTGMKAGLGWLLVHRPRWETTTSSPGDASGSLLS
jgi:hypothetical protein